MDSTRVQRDIAPWDCPSHRPRKHHEKEIPPLNQCSTAAAAAAAAPAAVVITIYMLSLIHI